MLNWLPFGFEIASYDEQIQFANSQFSALFGYSQDEISNIDDWFRLSYPDPQYREYARSKWEDELAKARAEDREMTPFDLEVRTASGQNRTIQFRHRTVGNFNRLRQHIAELEVLGDKGESIRFTISIGVATALAGNTMDTPSTLVSRADKALYQAKDAGRNRVVRNG
eukprot:gene21451-21393_t